MTPQDIDGVLLVEQQSFSQPWSRRAFEAEMEDNNLAQYLVLEDNEKIVGYAGLWLIVDEAHVTNIAVLPAYQGQGLGEKLLTSLIQQAKNLGAASMTLEVRLSNDVARSLYTKLGFVIRGSRRQYYSETKEDALIMWLDKL
jgi:ribosomal-protein-alanine N-acetyltransferase